MKKLLISLCLGLIAFNLCAQESDSKEESGMNNERLDFIINTISEEVQGSNGQWRFVVDSILFICLTDEFHNRMRIVSPIEEISNVSEEQMHKCMEANFHTALDSKYATSEGYLWSVFIHPLRELTDHQMLDALSQVYSSVKTFGSSYTSGALLFPNSEQREEEIEKSEKQKTKKKLKRS